MIASSVRMRLLGVGAMNSPRYRPAGLLVRWRGGSLMFDGGDGAAPASRVDAWLVTDAHAELIADIRRRAATAGAIAEVAPWDGDGVRVLPMAVEHTSHPTYGYLIEVAGRWAVWAPEFWRFPAWARGADLMFADAAGFARPIRFRGGAGGHASVLDTAEQAVRYGVRRLVYAHIGRPCIRAIDRGQRPPFGEWGVQDKLYRWVPAPAGARPADGG